MGLLDVLNGMANGPHGQTDPNAKGGKGGMSPLTMAILALLAYKGIKHLTANQGAPNAQPQRAPGAPSSAPSTGGGLGDILGGMFNGPGGGQGGAGSPGNIDLGGLLKGGLGGLLAGGAAGSVLSGGLGSLLNGLRQNGQGEAANSWVGTGPNKDLSESDMAKSIGADDIDALSRHTGMSRDELLSGLRQVLPQVVDRMTPDGRVPSGEELNRRL